MLNPDETVEDAWVRSRGRMRRRTTRSSMRECSGMGAARITANRGMASLLYGHVQNDRVGRRASLHDPLLELLRTERPRGRRVSFLGSR